MVGGRSWGDRIFTVSNLIIMLVMMLLTVYPFWFSFVNSLNTGDDLVRGLIFIWPRDFTWASWQTVMSRPGDPSGSMDYRVEDYNCNGCLYSVYGDVFLRLFPSLFKRQMVLHGSRLFEHVFLAAG